MHSMFAIAIYVT